MCCLDFALVFERCSLCNIVPATSRRAEYDTTGVSAICVIELADIHSAVIRNFCRKAVLRHLKVFRCNRKALLGSAATTPVCPITRVAIHASLVFQLAQPCSDRCDGQNKIQTRWIPSECQWTSQFRAGFWGWCPSRPWEVHLVQKHIQPVTAAEMLTLF